MTLLLFGAALMTRASAPIYTDEVTDYGRNRWRTHYTPTEPEYPLAENAMPAWEVPLGLSRSQPLVIKRDFTGDGQPNVRIFHLAGDRLWALNGDITPTPRQVGQSANSYRQQLVREGFILWSTPAEALCTTPELLAKDELLAMKCAKLGPRTEQRPFASSQAAYQAGRTVAEDVIYVGFGHPAAVVAIRAGDGRMLGGFMVDHLGDRGIVGAPLLFHSDTVVVGTTSGEAYIVKGLTRGTAWARGLSIGGRISFSPVPLGENAFLMASDARWSSGLGTHGYMMAYGLPGSGTTEFQPRWPAAVTTAAGIPAEAAIDANTVYFSDKFGKLYALRLDNGELLWCRQFPSMGPCRSGGAPQPGFINNGPGVDENHVYFVFRNNQGPNRGNGQVVALNKATGDLVWQQPMAGKGNTAPVPMGNILIVGDATGYVQAYDKQTGELIRYGGYPLKLSDEPYREGDQGERWWEPVGGTATQMTVAAGLMLVGVNSKTEENTVLKAYRLHRLPDLTLTLLDVPQYATTSGFPAVVRAVCRGCDAPLTTTLSFRLNGRELPRQQVTFRAENNWTVALSWQSGPQPQGTTVQVVATVDPDNLIAETDETNNTLTARVYIAAPVGEGQPGDRWGSDLTR